MTINEVNWKRRKCFEIKIWVKEKKSGGNSYENDRDKTTKTIRDYKVKIEQLSE